MDRLFCMQVFVRVVEHNSFSRAADALGIARSRATSAIAQLEDHLDTRLLSRTTRRISVTEEGQIYYKDCVRILGQLAEAEDGLAGARLEPRGRLRVSVPHSFVSAIFFPALDRFMEKYPQLQVEIVLTDRAVNLVEEGIDCALRGMEIAADAELVARKLSTCYWVTCAAPALLDRCGRPARIEALADYECIRFVSKSTGRTRNWSFCRGGETLSFEPQGRLRLTSLGAVTQAAIAGSGIAQIPDALVAGAISGGQLEPLLLEFKTLAPSLSLVYPSNRYLSGKTRAFIDFFADVFPREGWFAEIERTRD